MNCLLNLEGIVTAKNDKRYYYADKRSTSDWNASFS